MTCVWSKVVALAKFDDSFCGKIPQSILALSRLGNRDSRLLKGLNSNYYRGRQTNIPSIPAMSSDVEHVFSAAKSSIEEDRWRFLSDTIEALQCVIS